MKDKKTHIQLTMRSLYRFAELKKLNSPSSIVNNEKNILYQHFSKLSADDILFLALNFNNYYDEQQVATALEDERLRTDLAHYLNELN